MTDSVFVELPEALLKIAVTTCSLVVGTPVQGLSRTGEGIRGRHSPTDKRPAVRWISSQIRTAVGERAVTVGLPVATLDPAWSARDGALPEHLDGQRGPWGRRRAASTSSHEEVRDHGVVAVARPRCDLTGAGGTVPPPQLQPVKVEPGSGIALSTMAAPVVKSALQLPTSPVKQSIPGGLLVTSPPDPPTVLTVTSIASSRARGRRRSRRLAPAQARDTSVTQPTLLPIESRSLL